MLNTASGPKADDGSMVHIHELVAYQINTLSNAILRSASKHFPAELRLRPPEAWVLCAVGLFQPITAREVARRMSIDEAQVSRAIKSLAERKYISRRTAPDDKRNKVLTLSRSGERACGRALDIFRQRQERLLDGITEKDVVTLTRLLNRMRENSECLPPGT